MIANGNMRFVMIVVLFLAACSSTDTIKIGSIGPYSGPLADYGQEMERAYSIALDEINAEGGINGRQVEIIYEDTECIDVAGTVSALQKLNTLDQVDAVLGPLCGGATHALAQFTNDNEIFAISPGDNFGKIGRYLVNTHYLDRAEAAVAVEHMLDQGYTRVAVLYYNNEWGLNYLNGIKESFGAGEVVASEAYDFSSLDVRSSLLKMLEAKPDVLYITDPGSGDLFKQAEELGIDLPIYGEWAVRNILADGNYHTGLEGVTIALPVTKETRFHEKYRAKYGEEPKLMSLDAYDAINLMKLAMEACVDFDEQCMLDYVTSIEGYEGAGGVLTFNKEAWAFDKPFQLMQVRDGELVEI